MGKMRQLWRMSTIQKQLREAPNTDLLKVEKEIYSLCLDAAKMAKSMHSYQNIKGQLESSVGLIILKDRTQVRAWELLSKTGSDPALGIANLKEFITEQVSGKADLPDGTPIPSKSIIGIVFAAAPYAGYVENKGRTVLDSFMPSQNVVFDIIKSVVKS